MAQITIKYQYYTATGRRLTDIVTFDEVYGNNNRDKYRYSFRGLRGLQAYRKLINPETFGGQSFIDLMPTFKYPQEGFGPTAEQIAAGWPVGKAVPNPNYEAEVAQFEADKQAMRDLINEHLKLVCRVTFPAVRDTGDRIRWWMDVGNTWVVIPVQVGKYPGGVKWVHPEDEKQIWEDLFMNFVVACNNDKDKALRTLLMMG